MSDFLLPIGVGLLVFAVIMIFVLSSCGNNDKFNRFANACNAAGGQLSVTRVDNNGNANYECFKDDKQIQVPGFPGY